MRELPEGADTGASAALALTETISALASGTFLTVTGELKHDERVKLGGVEIKVGTLDIAAEALPETPIAADSGLDKRMDWRFLDLSQARNNLNFRVQPTLEHAMPPYSIEPHNTQLTSPNTLTPPPEPQPQT